MSTLTNAQVQAGESPAGAERGANAYRALIAANGGHDAVCIAYGLDTDAQDGGTYWVDVVTQAFLHGDIDSETGELA